MRVRRKIRLLGPEAADQRAADQRAADQRAADQRAAERGQKPGHPRSQGSHPGFGLHASCQTRARSSSANSREVQRDAEIRAGLSLLLPTDAIDVSTRSSALMRPVIVR